MIYGEQYFSSAVIFKILIASLPFMFFSLQLNYALGAIKLQGIVMKIIISLLIMNIILNFALIPTYGIEGAAIATLTTEFIKFLIFSMIASKYFHFSETLETVKILTFPLIIMIITVYISSTIGTIFSVSIGAASFSLTIYITAKNKIYSFFKG